MFATPDSLDTLHAELRAAYPAVRMTLLELGPTGLVMNIVTWDTAGPESFARIVDGFDGNPFGDWPLEA